MGGRSIVRPYTHTVPDQIGKFLRIGASFAQLVGRKWSLVEIWQSVVAIGLKLLLCLGSHVAFVLMRLCEAAKVEHDLANIPDIQLTCDFVFMVNLRSEPIAVIADLLLAAVRHFRKQEHVKVHTGALKPGVPCHRRPLGFSAGSGTS